MIRALAISSLLIAPPALAQPQQWNPVADYITVGQDEAGYRSWFLAHPSRAGQVKAFNEYLATYDAAGVVPTWQLFRTATSWEKCWAQPFEVPPTSEWPHIVQTLRYVRDYVIPAVGPVEPVSAYRNPSLNQCAGGAPESAHKHYSAVDLVPLSPITREDLMRRLCAVHGRRGLAYEVGLGFYAFIRFHVDTSKYRRWNMDPAVASHCPPIVRQPIIAKATQPSVQSEAQPLSEQAIREAVTPPTVDPVVTANDPPAPVMSPTAPVIDPLAPSR